MSESASSTNLHPDYTVVEGRTRLTAEWTIDLPGRFNRRIDEGALVLWRPGLTLWILAWDNENDEVPAERLAEIQLEASPEAFDKLEEAADGILRYAYRVDEQADDEREAALYAFAVGASGHLQIAMYFDAADDLETALGIWRSLAEDPS